MADYIPTIGIESHVQLKTVTKLFSAVLNDAREASPNTLISHICLGMPGALPVLNKQAVELAIRAAFALNTEPQQLSYFERKHYFYPDLPKGYQITQLAKPIVVGGFVDIIVNDKPIKVRINRVQIEEDAGKSTHPAGSDYSLVDLNRAGTPLLEIVSEADMHSAGEAKAYAQELWLLMRYTDISEADLYHGNMRFDVNVSLSKDSLSLGTRTETKNLNSFRAVEKAVEYEIARQKDLLDKGQQIVQETRGWDDTKQKTFSQRSKEDAHDYRYFPDPDLPPIVLDPKTIRNAKKAMPVLPKELRKAFKINGISLQSIETLIDAMVPAHVLKSMIDGGEKPLFIKKIANWFVTDVQALVVSGGLTWQSLHLDTSNLLSLASLVEEGSLSSSAAKTILLEMVKNSGDTQDIAKRMGLLQVSDESTIQGIVELVIQDNPTAVEDIKRGEMKAIGFLVGQVMKQSNGTANPALAQQLLLKLISN